MTKFLSLFCVLVFSLSLAPSAFAAEVHTVNTSNVSSFEIKDVIDHAQVYGVIYDNADVRIPVKLPEHNGIKTDLMIEMTHTATSARGTLNFNAKGNFYKTTDKEIVTVYGLSGSFEYTGSDTKISGKDSYHNSTASGWTGTHRTSTSKDNDNYHSSILTGHYTLFGKGKENNTASIKISVNQMGKYSVTGNYASYNVN